MALREHEQWWHAVGGNFLRRPDQLGHPIRKAIVDRISRAGAKTVLEAACATAIDYPAFESANIHYTGLDITPHLAARARELNPKAVIVDGSVLSPPFGEGSYDVVYCKDLLEHLAPGEYKNALTQMFRMSRKGILVGLFLALEDKENVRVVKRSWPKRLFDKTFFYNNTYARSDFMDTVRGLSSNANVEELEPNVLFAVWK